MKKKSEMFKILLSAGLILVVLAAGCGGGGEPDCSAVLDPCDELSALSCSSDNSAIEVCGETEAGCFEWSVRTDCTVTDQECDDSGGDPVCGCADACTTAGATQCQARVIQECQEGTNECLGWVETQDCAATGLICDASGGTAECVPGCTDACDNEDQTECQGTVIRTCTMGTNNCLDWVAGTDCAATDEVCNVVSGTARCEAGCDDTCATVNETQCSGTVIQICTENADECLVWTDGQDCADLGLACDDTAEPAVCPNGSGESCTDAEVMMGTSLVKSGTDFTVDYDDDMTMSDSSCVSFSGTSEAVFAVDLAAGQCVLVRELGGTDIVTSIQNTCGADQVCYLSKDSGETTGQVYTAAANERIYVIIETWSATPSLTDYEIHLDVFESDSPVCAPYKGYWQQFDTTDLVDVTGHSITFTPAPADVNLYTWAEAGGVTAYPVTPGSGTPTTALTLGDDANVEYTFGGSTTFTFFGTAYSSMYIGSNGYITFGAGDSDWSPDMWDFFDLPRIVPFWTDLNPSSAGTVTVDEFADRIVVTFDAVPRAFSTELVNFQVILHTDASTTLGVIEFHYVAIQVTDRGMVGIGNGTGNGTYPDETDFVPPQPTSYAAINEVAYDDDSTDDREFVELMGEPGRSFAGYTLVHRNGSDGSVIWAVDLSSAVIPSNGLFAIGASILPNIGMTWTQAGIAETDAIQNDGESVVLYTDWDGTTGTVVDALAYESAASLFGEGTPSTGLTGGWQTSIGRYPDGTDTNDNATDFVAAWWVTPGEPNTPAQPAGYGRVSGTVDDAVNTYPIIIPDGVTSGLDLVIPITSTMTWIPPTVGNIHVGVKISHGYIGDLYVTLTSPAGTAVILHNNTGMSDDDIKTVYDLVTLVDDTTNTMNSFNGQATAGNWTLHVADTGAIIEGQIEEWVLWITAP